MTGAGLTPGRLPSPGPVLVHWVLLLFVRLLDGLTECEPSESAMMQGNSGPAHRGGERESGGGGSTRVEKVGAGRGISHNLLFVVSVSLRSNVVHSSPAGSIKFFFLFWIHENIFLLVFAL